MADRAKNTSKKKKTYASAVVGIEEKNDFFTLAKCSLRRPAGLPNGRIPNTKETNSFFVDLKSTTATNAEVLNAINTAGIIGANVRDDLWVIEFVCKDEATVDVAMNTPFQVEGKTPVMAIMPRHKANKLVLIKIANVPFGQKEELTQAIGKYWSTYGKVIDVQPYQFPGRPWLTKRWDVLLQLNDGEKKLNASPVFNIDGYTDTLISTWNGAKKACLRCLTAGHSTSKCTVNNPKIQKVGELANPLQKIDEGVQSQKRKEKGSEKTPGYTVVSGASSSTITPATTSATKAVSAAVAQPSKAPSGSFTVTHPTGSLTPASTASVSAPTSIFGSELQHRQATPPPLTRPDPDTPTKGNKRMSKDEDAWTPTTSEVKAYVREHNICTGCCKKGHRASDCPTKSPIATFHFLASTEKFRPHMEAWANSRRKRGDSWRFYDIRVAGPYNPTICSRCHREGHGSNECTTKLKCNHCKGEHLGIDCPEKPTYAYEAMDIRQ
jgi:hypothetical protein